MNSHAEIQGRLSAYCGGDLEPAEHARIEAHLAVCPVCRTNLADLRIALRLIRTTPEVEPPPWLTSRIMAHLREEQPAKRGWLQRIWFPLHTGFPVKILALLVVCISGYYLSRTVETELKETARQPLQEVPAQQTPHPVQSPSTQDKQERPATALPKTAAPRQPAPEQTRTAPAPGAFAPIAPTVKDQYGGKAASIKAAPEAETDSRVPERAPEMKMKGNRSLQRNIDAAAPAASERAFGAAPARTLPRVMVRLSVADSSAAAPLIREAVLRAGGNIAEEPGPSGHLLKIRIPVSRQQELLEQLQQLGRIVERTAPPPGGGGAQLLEMNIHW